jgi:hypothetical protein
MDRYKFEHASKHQQKMILNCDACKQALRRYSMAFKTLPNAALFRIYQFHRTNALQAFDAMKLLVDGLRTERVLSTENTYFNKTIRLPDNKHPITFEFRYDGDILMGFKVQWSMKTVVHGVPNLWRISMEYHVDMLNAALRTNVSRQFFMHPTQLKTAWMVVLASAVNIFDRFVKDVHPPDIKLMLVSWWSFGDEQHVTAGRLVDAVRDCINDRDGILDKHGSAVSMII